MDRKAELAINGGPKAMSSPYGQARRFADNELKYLQEALEQNTLFYGHGKFVRRACEMMCAYTGRPYVVACTSGSAAVHLGMIAAGIGPGDEVIVTPNTDSGSVLGIIEEGAVPVFCDVDWTLQPTAATVAARITERTRAVEVIHLAGSPAPVDEIVEVCRPRGIAVVEDCAQAWGTKRHGRQVGGTGTAGCFSTNDFKHISTGEGGFVVLADETLHRRIHNYADKHYDRFFKNEKLQAHHGINYRMSELQGAVACAQLEKVDRITERQHALGEALRNRLADLPGARRIEPIPGAYCTYWWTVVFIEPDRFTVGRDALVSALAAEGVACGNYGKYDLIGRPLFQKRIARPWLAGDRALYPFVQPDGRSYTYSHEQTPVHKQTLARGIMVSVNAFYTERDMEAVALAFRKVLGAYARPPRIEGGDEEDGGHEDR